MPVLDFRHLGDFVFRVVLEKYIFLIYTEPTDESLSSIRVKSIKVDDKTSHRLWYFEVTETIPGFSL